MKAIKTLLIILLSIQFGFSQVIDMVNAPRNPIGFKHKKEHFYLKGDIYSSAGKIFDKAGNIIYNYGTRYYYENNDGRITGNNYGDEFKYDSRGNIIKFKYKSGSTNEYKFDSNYLLVFEKNSYGDEKFYTYDSQNRIIKEVINKKGVFYQQRDYTYDKKGSNIIVSVQYLNANKMPGFKGSYHYKNGFLVKEELASGTYEYIVDTDKKGNKINFYAANEPNAKEFKTFNRYYSDANKNIKIEFGYYKPYNTKDQPKLETVFIDGERDSALKISKSVRPNEKLIYDGLTQTYYVIPLGNPDDHTLETRIEATSILSKGEPMISCSYDGKFINYVHGENRVKSREFAFIGPHMVDYRIDKSEGRTYVVDNYQNIKNQSLKTMRLFTTNENSILYLRELEKDNFFIVVEGKHIDYKKARFEYLTNGDPVIFLDNKPLYILTGFRTAQNNKIYEGRPYNGELDTQNSVSSVTPTPKTQTTQTASSPTDYNCSIGDCQNGWGQVKVNNITTDATFKDGAINGVAYIQYPNNAFYHGEYVNNRRHGFGYYKWSTGNSYVGEWKDGKQHGLGYTMDDKNYITTAGRFENGKLVEKQDQDYLNTKKVGSCTGECSNGFGKYEYSNGDVYFGFFKNSQRYGVGSYSWNNNSAYTGAYTIGGKRNGFGIYTYVDGSVFRGMFTDDRIDGLGRMTYKKSGNTVKGVFNNKGAKIRDY
ncbi:MORN motif precursor [Winogradskyella litorisediminis]|uniref:MORN motif n=1 Tax=Winogradskyella litorisediminis TaxID=1156618 RepID=A0ABW3N6S4_9FLAO